MDFVAARVIPVVHGHTPIFVYTEIGSFRFEHLTKTARSLAATHGCCLVRRPLQNKQRIARLVLVVVQIKLFCDVGTVRHEFVGILPGLRI